jgi:hypothetical protein
MGDFNGKGPCANPRELRLTLKGSEGYGLTRITPFRGKQMKNYLMGTVFGALIVGLCVSVSLNCFLLSIVDEHVVLRPAPKDSGEPTPSAAAATYTASVDSVEPAPVPGYYPESAIIANTTPYAAVPVMPAGFVPPPMPYAPAPMLAPAPVPCQAAPCPSAGTTASVQPGQPCQATLTFSVNELGPQPASIASPFVPMGMAPACSTERCNQVYLLRNTAATNVATALNTFMMSSPLFCANGQQGGSCQGVDRQVVIVAEPITNKLLVSATPRGFKEVERLILELDATPQITPAVPTFAATLLKGCPAGACTAGGPCPTGSCAQATCPNTAACANAATAPAGACPATGCAQPTSGCAQPTNGCALTTNGCAQAATAIGLISGATFCPASGCQAATMANLTNLCPASTQTKTGEADLAAKLEKCLKK